MLEILTDNETRLMAENEELREKLVRVHGWAYATGILEASNDFQRGSIAASKYVFQLIK